MERKYVIKFQRSGGSENILTDEKYCFEEDGDWVVERKFSRRIGVRS